MIHAETSGGRVAALLRVAGHASLGGTAALGFALSASWSGPTFAVGLGPVTQQSPLGQSLRVVVPVLVSPGEDVGAECFRLAASEREVDGVPQIAFGRMSLERSADGARLVITNGAPVTEPVVRMTVQAGCETAVRREYVLLMDPPPIETPVVAAEEAPRSEVAQAPEAPPAATPARRARGTRAPSNVAPRGASEPSRSAQKPPAPTKPRSSAKAPSKRPTRAAGDQPRLSVSSAAPLGGANARAKGSQAEQARVQQELADALEAETVVLQRRIVELTAMVERMQEELRVAEAAAAQRTADTAQRTADTAQRTADEAAKPAAATPVAAKGDVWSDQNWPLLAAIAGLPLLLALGLLWRRRAQREAAGWPTARVATASAATTSAVGETTLQNTAAGMAAPTGSAIEPAPPKRTPPPARPARETATALAVSELSHVTEEARVYVALDRPERAIEVLSEHIRQVPRSLPAGWLMLLDLYHATNRREDFSHLADEFHVHCNVQAPQWDNFGSGTPEEGGLESFPHIQRETTRLWRQPGCREYLEKLLYDNREGRRIGFPLAAYSEILLLLQVLDAPPPVDIDSDLVQSGKLEPLAKPAAASKPADNPPPRVRAVRGVAVDGSRRPTQHPLDFEPDGNEGAAAS